ncbi:MAG TPA: hypothetical protein VER36_00760 [Flavisolibacter sp.]|nr:hypothetical protein [Flavisolibacter sp.]
MKWVLSHQSDDHHKWLLHEAHEPVQLTYNLSNHSLRIKSKNNRLFFLEITGFFQKKLLLRSEYGVVLGESSFTTTTKEGTLLMNELKYHFRIKNDQLSLSDKNKNLLSAVVIEPAVALDKQEAFALLFCQAWLLNASMHATKTKDLLVA